MTCNCNCNVNCLCKVCFLCYLWVSNKKGRSIQLPVLTYNIQDLEDYLRYAHLISLAGRVSQCFMDLNFSWWVVYDGEIVFWVHCDGKFARLLFKCLKVQFVPCSTISCSSHMEMYVNAKWHIFVHWAEATSLLLAPPHNTTTTVISLVTTVPPPRPEAERVLYCIPSSLIFVFMLTSL